MCSIKNISIALIVALALVAYAKPVKSCIGSFGPIKSAEDAAITARSYV